MPIVDTHAGIDYGLGQDCPQRMDRIEIIVGPSEIDDDRLQNIQFYIRLINHGDIQDTDRIGSIV